jgi:hypothetical protein
MLPSEVLVLAHISVLNAGFFIEGWLFHFLEIPYYDLIFFKSGAMKVKLFGLRFFGDIPIPSN